PAGNKTFDAFLREVARESLAALENQEYPLEDLVAQLKVDRGGGHTPLFDTLFVLQNIQLPVMEITGLALEQLTYRSKTAKFDLTLEAEEKDGKLDFIIEYCTKLFKPETVARYTTYYKELVKSILDGPGEEIARLEIIPEKEKQRLIYEFNKTAEEYPKDQTLHGLFARQVEKTPDNTAVTGKTRHREGAAATTVTVTYAQLNQKAQHLADILQEKGVAAGTIVAIKVERQLETIIGILAILKSGAAYMPIEPEYPPERITYMLKDSNAQIMLTNTGKEHEENRVIEIVTAILKNTTTEKKQLNKVGKQDHTIDEKEHHQPHATIAYIIYTSGTTGKPKGVPVTHDSVINLAYTQKKRYGIRESDRVLQFSSLSFDASVEQVYI
ncbi:MAG: AMP-binding protein, partial [bacterium]|nr:AMP-binding protein [bacterium]